MTTSLDGSVVPVRYYQALDPYNWKVDNRPLKDLEDNQEVLMSGIETALNTSKVGASTVSAVLQACFSTGVVVGDYSLAGPGLKVLLVNCVLPGSAYEDGRQVKTIGVQYDYEEFVFSAPASGNKKLITLSAKYLLADDSLMPYYDQTQILDALAMDLATSQIKYGTIDFTVTSNEVTNSAPNTYPSPPLGDLVLLNIKIEDSDTVIQAANVTVVSLVKTGQPVRQASQAQYGQVKFATPAEITDNSSNTVISPADLSTALAALPAPPTPPVSIPGSYYFPGAVLVQSNTTPSNFAIVPTGSGLITIDGVEYVVPALTTIDASGFTENTLYSISLKPGPTPGSNALLDTRQNVPVTLPFNSGYEARYDSTRGQIYVWDNNFPFQHWTNELVIGFVYKNTLLGHEVFRNMFHYYGRSLLNDYGTFSGGFNTSDVDYPLASTIDAGTENSRSSRDGRTNHSARMLFIYSSGVATPWGTGANIGYPAVADTNTSTAMTLQTFDSRDLVIGTICFPRERLLVKGTLSVDLWMLPGSADFQHALRLWDIEWLKGNHLHPNPSTPPASIRGWCLTRGQLENTNSGSGSSSTWVASLEHQYLHGSRPAFVAFDTVADCPFRGILQAGGDPLDSKTTITHSPSNLQQWRGFY